MRRERAGAKDAGTVDAAEQQSVEDYIHAKWIYSWEADAFCWPTKMKSRFVARGDMQRTDIDLGERYAPTVAVWSVLLLAAMACEQSLASRHFDVEQAYVQSELEKRHVHAIAAWLWELV